MRASEEVVVDRIGAALTAQRSAFRRDPFPDSRVRKDRLSRLLEMVEKNEEAFVQAIDADFEHRSAHETRLAEIFVVRAGIRFARGHLDRWMRARRVSTDLHFRPGYNRLIPQPLGVVGIVSPWNYPLQLSLGPAIAALAAGNRALLKPSELTPRFSELLRQCVAKVFAPEELLVVTGGPDVAQDFVSQPFDHLVFTGSTAVGRQVAMAAAKNLTPVTLELGGKSPAILDPTCDVDVAAQRVAYGKCLNAGQTCIAPDYLLVPTGMSDVVARKVQQAIERMYPSLRSNADYSSIISGRHRERLSGLIAEAKASGARIVEVNPAQERFDADTRKLPPTIVIGATRRMRLMQEEIFGPILPIVEYGSLGEAIEWIKEGERPLAMYWFGNDARGRERLLKETHAGGVTINDCLWHIAQENQPFGGVGQSGIGAYHGQWGFDRLSHLKPVFYQSRWSGSALFNPPYGKTFERLLTVLRRIT